MVIEINEKQFIEEIIDVDTSMIKRDNVIVDFYSSTCFPCRVFADICENVSKTRQDYTWYKVCVDDADKIISFFKLRSMPTLLVVKNGEYKTYPSIHTLNQLNDIIG